MTRVNVNLREGLYEDVDLSARQAKCYCGRTEPSDSRIAAMGFFEYRGAGSDSAVHHCGTCGYYDTAHLTINPLTGREGITEHDFVQRGASEFDSFYCGCRGWD